MNYENREGQETQKIKSEMAQTQKVRLNIPFLVVVVVLVVVVTERMKQKCTKKFYEQRKV